MARTGGDVEVSLQGWPGSGLVSLWRVLCLSPALCVLFSTTEDVARKGRPDSAGVEGEEGGKEQKRLGKPIRLGVQAAGKTLGSLHLPLSSLFSKLDVGYEGPVFTLLGCLDSVERRVTLSGHFTRTSYAWDYLGQLASPDSVPCNQSPRVARFGMQMAHPHKVSSDQVYTK